jgi:hypothetical protein
MVEALDLGLPTAACGLSSEQSACSDASGRNGERLGKVEVEFSLEGEQLTLAKQNEFKTDLGLEIAHVEQWAADRNWPLLHPAEFCVVVSDRFKISRSLVPAWSGHAGHMEFPAWRVIARKAAIAHELAHVYLPNGNRFLAEGLAVYVQCEIGGNPAFPNFGRPLHDLVREHFFNVVPAFPSGDPTSLEAVRLDELDAIATPSPLTLRIGNDFYGEEPRGQAHIYPLAGSFVQHLIESRGIQSFRSLYQRTPLVPCHHNAGPPERWTDVYGKPLSALESEWKSMIAGR